MQAQPSEQTKNVANKYPLLLPRFWHGMRLFVWLRLLFGNRLRMWLPRVHIAVGVTIISPINDLLAFLQTLLGHNRRIARTNISQDPIFIIGHWRSGTTLLHELMVTDPRFASPNTFQCFAPTHFMVSEAAMVRLGGFLLPKRRPMDNMAAGWELPQEDEFALMNLGLPTPYLRIAFPETQPALLNYLTLEELPESDRQKWEAGFCWFLKSLTYRYDQKQLVLKSPTHTGRVAELLKLFPNARFIHLTRDPVKLFPSTIKLWYTLQSVQALQRSPSQEAMEEYVLECHKRMYGKFEKDRAQIPPGRLVDIRYEDLVAAPLETISHVYQQLDIDGFDAARPALQSRLDNHASYKPNQFQADPALKQRVMAAWPEYCRKYGYE